MARDIAAERRDIDETVAGQTLCTLFEHTIAEHGDLEALKWKVGDDWKSLTFSQYAERVREFGNGMIALGLEPGEFVNVIGANRYEYCISDLGIVHAGGVPVSLYNTLAPEQIEYIVNHCEAVYVILENRAYYERFLKIKDAIPNIRKVIMWEGAEEFADDDWVISYEDVLAAGREYARANPGELDKRIKGVKPEGLCTLIYTSGTTGPPKGVMITHYNVLWTAESLARVRSFEPGSRQISYLPLAHIAERMVGLYLPIKYGSMVHFCPNVAEIGAYLGEVKPHLFFAVPRVWEKIYERLNAAIDGNPDPEQAQQTKDAIAACMEKVRLEQAGKPVPEDLAKKVEEAEIVTSLIRSLVGLDELQVAITGAAPIAQEILEWFHAVGVPIAEVYGQSEDTGPTSWNPPGRIKIGTVGPSLPGVEVKLDVDGEVLVLGGNVMRGYYKDPELTAQTIDGEGWLHSGDVAEIDDDGYLRIVDRKKEILITAGGKNIAPSNIENLLKQHPLVGTACVIGDQRPYCTALIALDSESAAGWAAKHDKTADVAELSDDPDVVAEIQAHVDEMNKGLHNQEQVKKFTILPTEWTVDSEELTPTLKLKRKVVNQKYTDTIESMYAK